MQIATYIALASALSCSASARPNVVKDFFVHMFEHPVFTAFYDSENQQLEGTKYEIGNTGCFAVGGAHTVSFDQAGGSTHANGPYCLIAHHDSVCTESSKGDASQEFRRVLVGLLDKDKRTGLHKDMVEAAWYRWKEGVCE